MYITAIRDIKPNFTSNKTHSFAFDDSISQERRIFLREHILEQAKPYYNITENNGRLEKYELTKLIGTLCGKKLNQDSIQNIFKHLRQKPGFIDNGRIPIPKEESINHHLIEELPLYNLEVVSKKQGVYRGETLQGGTHALKTIKAAGIERIVDLIGYDNLKEDCKALGLEYFKYPMSPYLFSQRPMFENEAEKRRTYTNHCIRLGDSEKATKAYVSQMMQIWRKNKDAELADFVKFIQTMQKGKLYIGCEYGTLTTDNALMLNSIFNPQSGSRGPRYITSDNRILLKRVEKLYQNLTPEHKQLMGWTKEFDKLTAERLRQMVKSLPF